jgi:lipopolysaccharide export system protein LptA|tara:strand:+ start:1023 stop:1679 length:657 start_codon:yes stop_codon:yes gene_type:complete
MNKCFFFVAFMGSLCGLMAQNAQQNQQRTSIDSDLLEMQGTEERNFFYFRGNVRVHGTDLEIYCDELTVTSQRKAESADETLGELGAIKKIVALGNVKIDQAGRQATAGRVEVDPSSGTIHFLEDPVIMQAGNEVRAYGFIFYTNEKRFETINPPGFVPGQARERTTLFIDTAESLTSLVPEEEVTVGAEVDPDTSTELGTETPESEDVTDNTGAIDE